MLTRKDRDLEYSAESGRARCDVTIVAHDIGGVGGMELQLAELVLGLRRLGDRVTVIARTCELPASAGVDFHRVRGPVRPFLLAYPWFMIVGSLMLRRWRRGVVQTTGAIVLNRVDVIAVHYCQQVGPTTPSRATRLFRAHARWVGHMVRIGERLCFGINREATFVGVSEGVAEDVRLHYPKLADRVITIPNGVDTEAFAPGRRKAQAQVLRERLQIGDEELLAAFVGSAWERKGLEPLIRALALTSGWAVAVAGSGDQKRYQQLADSLGVRGALRWLGVCRDVQLVYEMADALVLPSSYEAFSLVTLEAAASGLPILATPVNGVRELITDGQSGLLLSQDPRVIARCLSQLVADPERRTRMGRAARQSALGFRWEAMVARHQALYLRAAGVSRREPQLPASLPHAAEGRR